MLFMFFVLMGWATPPEQSVLHKMADRLGFEHWSSGDPSCRRSWEREEDLTFSKGEQLGPLIFNGPTKVSVNCVMGSVNMRIAGSYSWNGYELGKDKKEHIFQLRYNYHESRVEFHEHSNSGRYFDEKTFSRGLEMISKALPIKNKDALNFEMCKTLELKELVVGERTANNRNVLDSIQFPDNTKFQLACRYSELEIIVGNEFTFRNFKFPKNSKISGFAFHSLFYPKGNFVWIDGVKVENVGVLNIETMLRFDPTWDDKFDHAKWESLDVVKPEFIRNQAYSPKPSSESLVMAEYRFQERTYKYIQSNSIPLTYSSSKFVLPAKSIHWIDPVNTYLSFMALTKEPSSHRGVRLPVNTRVLLGAEWGGEIFFFPEDVVFNDRKFRRNTPYRFTYDGTIKELAGVYKHSDYGSEEAEEPTSEESLQLFEKLKSQDGSPVLKSRLRSSTVISVLGEKGATLGFLDERSYFCAPNSELSTCHDRTSYALLEKNIGDIIGFTWSAHMYEDYEMVEFKPADVVEENWQGSLICAISDEEGVLSWMVDFKKKLISLDSQCHSESEEHPSGVPTPQKITKIEKYKELTKIETETLAIYFLNGSYVQHTKVGAATPITHRLRRMGSKEVELITSGNRNGDFKKYIFKKTKYVDPKSLGC